MSKTKWIQIRSSVEDKNRIMNLCESLDGVDNYSDFLWKALDFIEENFDMFDQWLETLRQEE